LAGWPDVQNGASVVSTVKSSLTIRKPEAAPAGPWSCHIVQWPWLSGNKNAGASGNYAVWSRAGNVLSVNIDAPGNNAPVGGLVAYYVPEGAQLDITLGNGTIFLGRIDVPNLYTNGLTRLIGLGHEVHNTTAQINLQGSVTVWRMMTNENEKTVWVEKSTADDTFCVFDGPFMRGPPQNQTDALLLSGSRQWEAKDGVYSVAAFHSIENPATLVSPSAPVIQGQGSLDSNGVYAMTNVYAPLPGPSSVPGNIRGMTGFRVHNFHMHGEIFAGLSDETVLTLNQNCFLEKFPGPDDKETLPLATLSAEYDPDVLDLYSRLVSDLPVAVPVNENGLGDWFYDAAVNAAKYIGPVLSRMPHPLLSGLGTAVSGMSAVMQADKQPKKKKPQQKPKQSQLEPPNSWGPLVPAARRPRKRANKNQQQRGFVVLPPRGAQRQAPQRKRR